MIKAIKELQWISRKIQFLPFHAVWIARMPCSWMLSSLEIFDKIWEWCTSSVCGQVCCFSGVSWHAGFRCQISDSSVILLLLPLCVFKYLLKVFAQEDILMRSHIDLTFLHCVFSKEVQIPASGGCQDNYTPLPASNYHSSSLRLLTIITRTTRNILASAINIKHSPQQRQSQWEAKKQPKTTKHNTDGWAPDTPFEMYFSNSECALN